MTPIDLTRINDYEYCGDAKKYDNGLANAWFDLEEIERQIRTELAMDVYDAYQIKKSDEARARKERNARYYSKKKADSKSAAKIQIN